MATSEQLYNNQIADDKKSDIELPSMWSSIGKRKIDFSPNDGVAEKNKKILIVDDDYFSGLALHCRPYAACSTHRSIPRANQPPAPSAPHPLPPPVPPQLVYLVLLLTAIILYLLIREIGHIANSPDLDLVKKVRGA